VFASALGHMRPDLPISFFSGTCLGKIEQFVIMFLISLFVILTFLVFAISFVSAVLLLVAVFVFVVDFVFDGFDIVDGGVGSGIDSNLTIAGIGVLGVDVCVKN
jgi:hypothetical protein